MLSLFLSLAFFFLPLLQPGVTDQAFQVKWFFSEPFFFLGCFNLERVG